MQVDKSILKALGDFFTSLNCFTIHKSFLYEWLDKNKTQFSEKGDMLKLETLLNLTASYLNSKEINGWNQIFFDLSITKKTLDTDGVETVEKIVGKPNKGLNVIKDRVPNHLKKALKDLNLLVVHGSKTKQAIEMIQQCIDDIDEIIMTRPEQRKVNVEDIRIYLKQNGFTDESIKSYIEQFRKPYDDVIQDLINQGKATITPQ